MIRRINYYKKANRSTSRSPIAQADLTDGQRECFQENILATVYLILFLRWRVCRSNFLCRLLPVDTAES
jgi:hypothetical protein